ncbi:branched-chain amino acid ABC transporter permease [Anaerolentibacter hominis]|uniref:branched-chain amino acid ABC transporter permease n=1 Tax=Anaerolentibacter hominis TaxID=3079009 RepID=UPI0031B841E0
MITKLRQHKVTVAVIGVLCVICGILSGETYNALIISLAGIYAIATTGLDLLFGYTGQISFGHAAFFAIGSYGTTLLSMRLGIPTLLSVILASVIAMAAGIVIALPASKLVKHFLSLLTIAFGQIIYLLVNSWSGLTGGAGGISGIPDFNLFGLELNTNRSYMVFIWILAAVILLVKQNIIHSRVGRGFIAIRENTHAAQGMGVNVRYYKIMAFAISAAMAGLAGAMYAHLVGFISPETYNATQSTLFMTMLLFGGIATASGPFVGAAILLLVKEVFQSFASYQVLIYGIFILIVLFFFPNGTVGILKSIKARIARRKNTGGKTKQKGEKAHAYN